MNSRCSWLPGIASGEDSEAPRSVAACGYDFRPDPGGRSLGELAWHLAESDAYISYGIERGAFTMDMKPPNMERPLAVAGSAPGYERVHAEAVTRIRKLTPEDSRSNDSLLYGTDAYPRHHVERDPGPRNSSSGAAQPDVPPRWRSGSRHATVRTGRKWPQCKPRRTS